MACAKSPVFDVCPGTRQFEWDSLKGFGVLDKDVRILGGRARQYTPFGGITLDLSTLAIAGIIVAWYYGVFDVRKATRRKYAR